MSFQAYIDNIKAKTGKTPEDFKKIAEKKGLLKPGVKAGEIVAWLKQDFGLGHGHAMAIYAVLKAASLPGATKDEKLEKHFSGEKEKWRTVFERFQKKVKAFGDDVSFEPVASYISILKAGKKFALVQVKNHRLDIGIKLRGQDYTDRFEDAGNWNEMMTHKVSVISSTELDKEFYAWLQRAYCQVGQSAV